MKLILLFLFCLLDISAASNNNLAVVELSGIPDLDNSKLKKVVNFYIQSEGIWDLYISALDLLAVEDETQYVLPAERLKVRVNDESWVPIDTEKKKLYSGFDSCNLVLEYCFNPYWQDRVVKKGYESEISITLTNGTIYPSYCEPNPVTPGETVKIVFAKEKVDSALLRVSKKDKVFLEQIVYNDNQLYIETENEDGVCWPEGEYVYELSSRGVLFQRGILQVADISKTSGAVEGSLYFSDELGGYPFVKLYDANKELLVKLEDNKALNFSFTDLQKGNYYLEAGSEFYFTKEIGPLYIEAGKTLKRDIYLTHNKPLEIDLAISPKKIEQGGKGSFFAGLKNSGAQDLFDLKITFCLSEGLYWKKTDSNMFTLKLPSLKEGEYIAFNEDLVASVFENKNNLFVYVTVEAKTEKDTPITKEAILAIEVIPGLIGEPGILIGESNSEFYFANGTKVIPDEGYFSLHLPPGNYGILLGSKPFVLNVSHLSERIQLPQAETKKAGLLELSTQISSQPTFRVQGFYDTDNFKMAFTYPSFTGSEDYLLTPYPKWGKKNVLLDKTPWQVFYKKDDWHINAGTVYSQVPLKRSFSHVALVGTEMELSPTNGVQLKALGGFTKETKKQEEFLADDTTGPFILKSFPKDGTVTVHIEARDSSNYTVKRFLWDYYLDNNCIRLKRPLAKNDELGLTNVIVISYVSDMPTLDTDFFAGGYIGYKDQNNSIYLFRHQQDEGIMGTLQYKDWSLEGMLANRCKDASLARDKSPTVHKIRVSRGTQNSYSYRLDYNGNWKSNIAVALIEEKVFNKAELDLGFKSKVLEVLVRERLNLKKDHSQELGSQYSRYSILLNWPSNLTWGLEREKFLDKTTDTFSSKMHYQMAGFRGYVEGKWKNPETSKPKVEVSVSHDKIPLTLKAEWEQIAPKFSLFEATYDTKNMWVNILLCNEKDKLRRTMGITLLPKNNLVFLAMKDENLKSQVHLPLDNTQIRLSYTGNLATKATAFTGEIDVSLSEKSLLGLKTEYQQSPQKKLQLQGIYRYRTDNKQLEICLGQKDSGFNFTYLIPLGKEQLEKIR